MSTTSGNMKSFKVTDKDGNVFVMTPVDTEARQAIDEAKNLEFDGDYFTSDLSQDQSTVSVGLNGVPLGVDTPLEFTQDTAHGIVIGLDTITLKTEFTGAVADGNTGFPTGDAVYDAIRANCNMQVVNATGTTSSGTYTVLIELDKYNIITVPDVAHDMVVEVPNPSDSTVLRHAYFEFMTPENGTLDSVSVITDPNSTTGTIDFIVKGRNEYFHDVKYLGTITDDLVSIDRYVQPIEEVGTSDGDEIVTSDGDEVVVGSSTDYIVTDTIDKRISNLDLASTVEADDHLVMDSSTLGYRAINVNDLLTSKSEIAVFEVTYEQGVAVYPNGNDILAAINDGKYVVIDEPNRGVWAHIMWKLDYASQGQTNYLYFVANEGMLIAEYDHTAATPAWVWRTEGSVLGTGVYAYVNGVMRKIHPDTKLFVEGLPVNNVDYDLFEKYNAMIYTRITALSVSGSITLGLWNYDTKTYVSETLLSTDANNPTVIDVSLVNASDTMEIHLKGTGTLDFVEGSIVL